MNFDTHAGIEKQKIVVLGDFFEISGVPFLKVACQDFPNGFFWVSRIPEDVQTQCTQPKSNPKQKSHRVSLHRVNFYIKRVNFHFMNNFFCLAVWEICPVEVRH